jgi:hypothetical protein
MAYCKFRASLRQLVLKLGDGGGVCARLLLGGVLVALGEVRNLLLLQLLLVKLVLLHLVHERGRHVAVVVVGGGTRLCRDGGDGGGLEVVCGGCSRVGR